VSNDRDTADFAPFVENLKEVVDNVSAFVAGPEPSSPIAAAVHRRYRDACDSYSNAPGWLKAMNPLARDGVGVVCNPYLEGVGSGQPGVGPTTEEPRGCQPIVYDEVRVTGLKGSSAGPVEGSFINWTFDNIQGPVTSPVVLNPGTTNSRLAVTNGVGVQVLGGTETFGWGPAWISDTDPDDPPGLCGVPEVPIGPNPNPRPDPGLPPDDEPFEGPGGEPIFPMPEVPNPFGDPVQLPNFPGPNPAEPVPPQGPGDQPDPVPPGDTGSPKAPQDTGLGEEAEGAESDEYLVGVAIAVLSEPSSARVTFTPSGPVYLGACFLYMGGNGGLDLQQEARYLQDGQFFYAPETANAWKVIAAPGYNLRVTPYYREVE